MNTKVIIGIFVAIIAVVGGLIWLGQPAGNQNGSQANLTAGLLKSNETDFDFGTISMANGKVSHEFEVTNSSSQPVNIKKIYSSCMCTAANFKFKEKTYGPFGMEGMGGLNYTNITIDPGDSGTVEVIYDPNAHGPAGVGPVDRLVYVEDKNGGQLILEIKAVVTP